jgi:hypothetical protein
MGMLSSIELPHWLMIGGATLIAMGFLGLAFSWNEVATHSESSPPRAIARATRFILPQGQRMTFRRRATRRNVVPRLTAIENPFENHR